MKKTIINILLFISLITVTFFLIFKDQNITNIFSLNVDYKYVAIGILCMSLFILCESLNIKRCLKLFGYKLSLLKNIKYALIGFFFSSITPSSTGGQPMQVYFMHKDGVNVSHSALGLLIELSSFQLVLVLYALIGFFTNYSLFNSIGNLKYFLLLGLILNITLLLILLFCIFSKKISSKVVNLIVKIFKFFKYKKHLQLKEKLEIHLEEYQKSSSYFRKNKLEMLKIFLVTLVQIFSLHVISYLVYRAFGLNDYSLWTVFSMQAVLYISVCALPLPGAVGISEGGFLILYKTLYSVSILSGAMLLSRTISFYLPVLISGIIISLIVLFKKKVIKT